MTQARPSSDQVLLVTKMVAGLFALTMLDGIATVYLIEAHGATEANWLWNVFYEMSPVWFMSVRSCYCLVLVWSLDLLGRFSPNFALRAGTVGAALYLTAYISLTTLVS